MTTDTETILSLPHKLENRKYNVQFGMNRKVSLPPTVFAAKSNHTVHGNGAHILIDPRDFDNSAKAEFNDNQNLNLENIIWDWQSGKYASTDQLNTGLFISGFCRNLRFYKNTFQNFANPDESVRDTRKCLSPRSKTVAHGYPSPTLESHPQGIYLNLRLDECTFLNGDMVSATQGVAQYVTFNGCLFDDMGGGIKVDGEAIGAYPPVPSRFITVENCTFQNMKSGYTHILACEDWCQDIYFRNNTFYNPKNIALKASFQDIRGTCSDIVFSDNTIYNPENKGLLLKLTPNQHKVERVSVLRTTIESPQSGTTCGQISIANDVSDVYVELDLLDSCLEGPKSNNNRGLRVFTEGSEWKNVSIKLSSRKTKGLNGHTHHSPLRVEGDHNPATEPITVYVDGIYGMSAAKDKAIYADAGSLVHLLPSNNPVIEGAALYTRGDGAIRVHPDIKLGPDVAKNCRGDVAWLDGTPIS